jgi:hypothetical protein
MPGRYLVLALLEGGNQQLQHFLNVTPNGTQFCFHPTVSYQAALYLQTSGQAYLQVGGSGMCKDVKHHGNDLKKQERRSPEETTTTTCHVNKLPQVDIIVVAA